MIIDLLYHLKSDEIKDILPSNQSEFADNSNLILKGFLENVEYIKIKINDIDCMTHQLNEHIDSVCIINQYLD
jgi:hypothetical protein